MHQRKLFIIIYLKLQSPLTLAQPSIESPHFISNSLFENPLFSSSFFSNESFSFTFSFLRVKNKNANDDTVRFKQASIVTVVGNPQAWTEAPPSAGPRTSPSEYTHDHKPATTLCVPIFSPNPPALQRHI